jgi:hypothetical protein
MGELGGPHCGLDCEKEKNVLAPPGYFLFEPRAVESVASHYTDCATVLPYTSLTL